MTYPVIKASSYVLVHTPDVLKQNGATQVSTRLQDPNHEYLLNIDKSLRNFDEVVRYAPNQVYIGNVSTEDLREIAKPWFKEENLSENKRFGKFGEIMPQDEFYLLVQHADSFGLVLLTPEFIEKTSPKIEVHPVLSKMNIKNTGTDLAAIKELVDAHAAEGLYQDGELIGCVKEAHNTDENLSAHFMLENLMVKASGALTLMNMAERNNLDLASIDYIIECSEEACGDVNQRGGGNFAKAVGEVCGCVNATGSDVRSFCAAPAHAVVYASSLVKSGIYKNVVVVAGGAVAKLGMNGKDHVKKEMPILEDTLGGFAVCVSENDGVNPIIRTDIIGRHKIGTGSSPQAVMTSLIAEPLERNNLKIVDIDKYSPEMQNPEITVPAGAGDVPLSNFKMIGALAVKRKEMDRKDIQNFVNEHGVIGFAVTQGHIPSGVPYIGPARELMLENKLNNAMIVGKGSLFLGRMTNLFDGVSFVIEKNPGKVEETEAFDEAKVKSLIAESMRKMAATLFAEE
ncbi:MAG: glycine reductase [Candidatus Cloacimonadota bacterium]|nr:MAG: glycine reductase [Candidatus Cloacimonadota bacterium]